jgi:DoxX-like family
MNTTITIIAAVMVGFSAVSVFIRGRWVVEPLSEYGVPESWWPWLGIAKAAGAIGLLAGLALPWVGVAAAVGLVLYFLGAVITVVRAKSWRHIPFPLLYVAPVIVALAV